MFDKVLIANRGEIALRIHRACREMGIRTVAVHSEIDTNAMHVRLADESVCIGPAPARDSYLNIPAIISAAMVSGADAIHPGYGFLAENYQFAEIVAQHGIVFIGPGSEHIRLMGDKLAARSKASELGLPVVPGSESAIADLQESEVLANQIGYPVLLKASAGGGGRGISLVRNADELQQVYTRTKLEAQAGFGDDSLYVEKFLERPRHIEVQVVGDQHGNAVAIGERDCSIQRRHQKLVEEAPSPALNSEQRQELNDLVATSMQKLGYDSLGTVEFLYENGSFYFIEMNTRLQVEHPVTEMITGIDLVREQIRIASGAPLGNELRSITSSGHAIECRVTAEEPGTFLLSPGRSVRFTLPEDWVCESILHSIPVMTFLRPTTA